MSRPFTIRLCDVGRGVFATRRIAAGQLIYRFSGRLITKDEVLGKGETSMNPLQISPILYIDLRYPG